MSDAATIETDPRDLKISEQAEALAALTKENEHLKEQNKKLAERIKRLEALLTAKVDARSSKKPVFTENYSLDLNNSAARTPTKSRPGNQPVASPLKPKYVSSAIRLKSFR